MKPIGKVFHVRNCGFRSAFVLTLFMLLGTGLYAQGYGSISGTVTDPTGAAVSGSVVVVTQTDTGRQTTATASQSGAFVFPTLPPASYSLKVTTTGFRSFQQKGIIVQADQSVTINPKLALGEVSETVEVTSTVPQIDTTTGTLSQVIDRERVVDLPLNGRNAAALITLVAGVVDATNEGNGANQGNGKTFPAAVITSTNGTLPNQSNYLLDGGNNVDEMTNVNGPFPFPDALQEFSVQTSNYNAEFGQSAGAVVNIVTKSGTRKFHGSAFEFLRNGYFNAKPYFAASADNLHRHQFGGTIGGPVIIPHFSTGTTTQFFFGYQHTLVHQNSNANTTTVPTLAEEGRTASGGTLPYADLGNLCAAGFNAQNICTNASQQILNPFTNAAYPLNRIPSSDFDPAAVAYQKVFPTYSGTEAAGKIGGLVSYYKPTVQYFNEYVSRVDHDFGTKNHLFGRYYYNFYNQAAVFDPNNLASYQSYFNTRYQNALLSDTHVFTTNLVNSLVLNYQREVALRGGPPGSSNITAFGVKNIWQPDTGPYLAATITGYFGASSSAFAGWGRNNYTFNDDVHWVKGSHNIGFGGHFELSKFDVTNVFQSYGAFGFGTATNKIGSTSYQYPNAYANFLLGFMTSFGQGNYELVNDRNHFPGVYLQDSWKVTPRLQLNYGLRWESFAPWSNRIGSEQQFSASAYAANRGTSQFTTLPAGLLLSGDPGVPKNGVRNKYTQFMPRVGFALDVFGNGKTAVRGGFGIFYQDRLPGFFNLSQASFVPNTISITLTNPGLAGPTPGANPGGPFSNPYCTGCAVGSTPNPFPFSLPFPSTKAFPNGITVAEYDPSGNFQIPVTDDFNLIVEQQLAPSWSARFAYVGSVSRHQFVNLEINPSVNNGSGLSTNARRVYNTAPTIGPCASATGCNANYSQIIMAAMIGNANFNSFQATLEKKMSHGLSLLLNYTFSKSLDDMPQATRISNTEDLNAGASYVYPLYPSNATGIPAAAYVTDIKALDRGISDIDHPQVVSASYVYKFPKAYTSFAPANFLLNGWRITGLVQHHSGDSLTAYTGTDNSLTGLSQDRAQRDFTKPAYSRDASNAGDCQAGKSCVNWLNNAAFSVPANTGPGTGFGNVVKGTLRGPGYTNMDAAVIRSFRIYRESALEFRAEYFDVLNHTELGNPNTSNPISSSTSFGTITSTQGGPRVAQFSLKYAF
ncbi:Carboxypeptidase regulatory-like domain-containing protein [Granulicella pectinivorans]|uniref:Carboxypeptidase regulatory-like domain-containing protein n=2 Tax=Granulicella pectinivorans TaxID=474950 RepID=A0A1I6M5R1_9BACT|nr:Carboxypeptidase regulatory-like domain-containing protein [Granulicella pectinivorans]